MKFDFLRRPVPLMLSASALAMLPALSAPALAQTAAGQAGSQTGSRDQAEAEAAATGNPEAGVTQAQSDEPPGSGDIIVTAQKRAERLQDVPLAVTAVGGDALAARQINDSNSLAAAVPSLTYTQGANPTNTSFRIRGIGTQLFGIGTEPSVSVVVDGIVAARSGQGFTELADIERIEVLRGPQGTLFGRNATAGVISIVTARPAREFGGRADFTIAEKGEYRARGTVTGPLSDTVRARLTGYYSKVGGYIDNLTTGREVNGNTNYGLRGKLEWDATDNLNLLFLGEYTNQKSKCCVSVNVQLVTPQIIQVSRPQVAGPNNRTITDNEDAWNNSRQWTGSVQAELDLGAASLTSITAYQDYKLANNQPVDRYNSVGNPFLGAAATYSTFDLNGGGIDLKNLSQELRLSSSSSFLNYVVGLYYNHFEVDRSFQRRRVRCTGGTLYQPCAAANTVLQSSRSLFSLTTNSYSLFGQIEPRIVGRLKAILGGRIQYEEGTNRGNQYGPLGAGEVIFPGNPTAFPVSGTLKANDWATTGKAGLQYEFSRNAQAYATYTRGYKGIGYATEAATDPRAQTIVNPENVDAFEIGTKFSTPDRVLTLAVAGFLAKYDNLQVQANRSDPVLGTQRFEAVNAGSSETKGVEIEGVLRPVKGFVTNFGLTYSRAKVDVTGLNCPLQFQANTPIYATNAPFNTCFRTSASATPLQNVRGGTLPNSPEWRFSVSPRLDGAISDALATFFQLNVAYQSKVNFALEQDPLTVQKGYALVDASVGIKAADDRWNLTLFVRNLFDRNYFSSIGHGSVLATPTTPFDLTATIQKDADRFVGATFGVRF